MRTAAGCCFGIAGALGRPRAFTGAAPAAFRPATPGDAVRAALPDAERVCRADPERAPFVRYLCAYHLSSDAEALRELYRVTCLHFNLLSTNGFIEPLRVVDGCPWLWRADLTHYRINDETYAKTIFGKGPFAVDPWFHVIVPGKVNGPGGTLLSRNGNGDTPMAAPWLPTREIGRLSELVHSNIPVARADWFIHRTAVQAGRDGFGYYDQLGVKDRDGFDKIGDLDRKAATRVFREQASVIAESGVAASGERQLFRLGGRTGGFWVTHDVSSDTLGQKAQNVQDQRFEDLKHQAEEGVGTLPNKLPYFYLSTNVGVLQKTAPDTIVQGDRTATGTDKRIHVGLSCMSCHEQSGLKPFRPMPLRPDNDPVVVADKDRAFQDRLKAAYHQEYAALYKADVEQFADAIQKACLLKPSEASAAYRRAFDAYDGTGPNAVSRAAGARDFGVTEEELVDRLKAAFARKPDGRIVVHPTTLDAWLTDTEPGKIARGKEEELVPLVMTALGNPGVSA